MLLTQLFSAIGSRTTIARQNMNSTVKSYVPLVDFLEAVLGKNSEIVLHDFSDPDHSIIDIRNGEVSGRKIGSPATDLALKILNESAHGNDPYANQHHITEYISHGSSMKQLRSVSYLIRENGLIVGMLCVNTDVGPFNQLAAIAQQLSGFYTNTSSASGSEDDSHALEVESLTDSTQDLIVNAITRICAPRGISPDKLSQTDRIEIIRDLNNNGMFLLKGAVATVAEVMGVSEPSVYRYLQKVKKEQ